ncbi:MAG: hypothetical protein JW966_15760 [Anaerolineae bacterium]|nr:hypothetical protein [Anaerolineae bacterium]
MDYSLISDWLGREGGDVFVWWLLVTLAGMAAWPLLFRVMGGLPDRGYTLARTAGVMLTGFIFWFLGSLGLLRNTPGGMVFAWVIVLVLGLAAFFRWDERPPLRDWFRDNCWLILLTEVLFLALLFGWAIFRAHNPEMRSTEKPMEIMFMNGIRASDTLPPNDPWMSGYAISYYYFGYLIMAMLAELSGVASGVAFNTTIALLFALAGIGALGVTYNMVRARSFAGRQKADWRYRPGSQGAGIFVGLLGMCFVILIGNLGTTLVEIPYHGYVPGVVDERYFDFLDVSERSGTQTVTQADGGQLDLPIDSDGDTIPNWDDEAEPVDQWGYWWWFRYSRVVNDRDLDGDAIDVQPITEFPQFSFVLADIHPHVLALPFALLAIGLALGLVLGGRDLAAFEYPLYAIWVGGMIFMNSWDAAYLVLLFGAEALRRMLRSGTGALSWPDLLKTARFALVIGGLTVVLLLPWLLSFTSQASGILPNVIYPTSWQQYVLQFGIFLVILVVFLLVEVKRAGRRFHWQAGVLALTVAASAAVVSVAILGASAWERGDVRNAVYEILPPNTELRDIVPDVLNKRLPALPSELLLLAMVLVVVGRLFARPLYRLGPGADGKSKRGHTLGLNPVPDAITYSPATGFALLLIGAGAVLTFAPDFVYLQDNFSVRINTVFKLYYQGWIMFGLAAAFGAWSVLAGTLPDDKSSGAEPDSQIRSSLGLVSAGRWAFGVVLLALFAAGMAYPVLAMRTRALVETGRLTLKDQVAECESRPPQLGQSCPEMAPLTLDGTPNMVREEEYAAIQCLAGLEQSSDGLTLVEAPGGAYAPDYSRFSGLTGIPTLIGWQNHERQWRGKTYADVTDVRFEDGQYRDRVMDVQELYTTLDWDRAWAIIDRYDIDYIVIGFAERQWMRELAGDDSVRQRDFDQGLGKFAQVLTPVCESGEVAVFRVAPN